MDQELEHVGVGQAGESPAASSPTCPVPCGSLASLSLHVPSHLPGLSMWLELLTEWWLHFFPLWLSSKRQEEEATTPVRGYCPNCYSISFAIFYQPNQLPGLPRDKEVEGTAMPYCRQAHRMWLWPSLGNVISYAHSVPKSKVLTITNQVLHDLTLATPLTSSSTISPDLWYYFS